MHMRSTVTVGTSCPRLMLTSDWRLRYLPGRLLGTCSWMCSWQAGFWLWGTYHWTRWSYRRRTWGLYQACTVDTYSANSAIIINVPPYLGGKIHRFYYVVFTGTTLNQRNLLTRCHLDHPELKDINPGVTVTVMWKPDSPLLNIWI